MSAKLKTEMVHNGDGTVTMIFTQDISAEIRYFQEMARQGKIGVIRNVGVTGETAIMVAPQLEPAIVWRKADE